MHVSTGEMFRALDVESPVGKRVRERIDKGLYVSDELVIEMIEERVSRPDAKNGYILDGFPRTLGQVHALDKYLGEDNLDRVVLLSVAHDELVRRLLARGRKDDVSHTIELRMHLYVEQTEPLISVYRERGIVLEVDAEGPIEEVTLRILNGLGVEYTDEELESLANTEFDSQIA